jgi:GTP cyclohydrolase II
MLAECRMVGLLAEVGAAVEQVVAVRLPTTFGEFTTLGYQTNLSDREYVVLLHGEPADLDPAQVHLHFGCLQGDVFGSRLCACGSRLSLLMETVAAEGGAIVYLPRVEDCAGRATDPIADPTAIDRRVAGLIVRDIAVERRVTEAL